MRMNKSTMAVCMVMLMVGLVFVTTASPAEGVESSEYSDYKLDITNLSNLSTCEYDGNPYLVIKNAGDKQYYTTTGFACRNLIIDTDIVHNRAFAGSNVMTVVLTEKVREIEEYAFYNCKYLTSVVKIGDTNLDIADRAFAGCTNLELLDVRGCDQIGSKVLDKDTDTIVVTDMDNLDVYRSSTITIPNMGGDDYFIQYDSGSSTLKMNYVGSGLLQCTDGNGGWRQWSHSVGTDGDRYIFPMDTGTDMRIEIMNLNLECAELGNIYVRMTDKVMPLPSPNSLDGTFEGWLHDGTPIGNEIDETEALLLGADARLTPSVSPYKISFDTVSGLPAGETALEVEDITGSYGTAYPSAADTEHYELVGWEVDGTAYSAGDAVQRFRDHTAVGIWALREECYHTVSYLNFDGSVISESAKLGFGSTYTIDGTAPSDVPAIDVFAGWMADDSEKVLHEGDVIAITGDIILTPISVERERYTVTYMSGSEETGTDIAHAGIPYTVGEALPDGERIFVCWTAGGEGYLEGDILSLDGDIVLTAEWRDRETYRINYIVNDNMVSSDTAIEGIPYGITSFMPEDDERIFVGWRTYGTGEIYTVGNTVNVTSAMTFEGLWRIRGSYDVAFVSEGSVISVGTAREGIPFTIDVRDPTGSGIFTGWSDGDVTVTNGESVDIGKDTEFTAQWRDRMTFAVTFVHGDRSDTDYATEGLPYTIELEDPEGEGVFLGWKADSGDLHVRGDSFIVSSDIALVAEWREYGEFAVRFVDRGSTVLEKTVKEGSPLTIDLKDPTDDELIFTGWLLDGTSYFDGDSVQITEDSTLTSGWRERGSFTVTVDIDGKTSTVDVVEGVPFVIDMDDPTNSDRIFLGWRVAGQEGLFRNGDSVMLSEGASIVAEWRERERYQVTYESDGEAVGTDTAVEGIPFTVDAAVDSDEKVFIGWTTDDDVFLNGDSVILSRDTTFVAQWRDLRELTVTTDDGRTVHVKEGNMYIIDLDDPTDPDRIFLGWRVTGCDELLQRGDEIAIRDDTTLTAEWRDRCQYRLTIDTGSGTSEIIVLEDMPYTIEMDDPTDPDMVFIGWEISGQNGIFRSGDAVTIAGDSTITAKWRDRGKYVVSFTSDGATVGRDVATEGIPFRIDIADPDDKDRMFLGWDAGEAGTLHRGDDVLITDDTELSAIWRERDEIAITFDDGDGKRTVTVTESTEYRIDVDDPMDPDRVFLGWRVPGIDGLLNRGDPVTLDKDTTFTAEWRSRHLYTVTYVSDSETVATAAATEGREFTVHMDMEDEDGRIFVGWTLDGKDKVMVLGDTVLLIGDATLVAKWRDRTQYPLTFYDGMRSVTLTAAEGLPFTVSIEDPVYGDKVFLGWMGAGTSLILRQGDTFTPDGSMSFFAQWRDRHVYTVTFVSDGTVLDSKEAVEGSGSTIDVKDPESDGRKFLGWRHGDSLLFHGDELTVSEDTSLVAEWRMLDQFTVTVPDGDGTKDIVVTEGQEYVIDLEDPTDPERIFLGWRVTGYDELLHKGDSIILTGDVEIVPEWRDRHVYTVTFISDGDIVQESSAVEGREFIITVSDPGSEGKKFLGWRHEDSIISYGDALTVTENTVLTAEWEVLGSFTVTVPDGDGAKDIVVTEGQEYVIDLEDPTDPERIFLGWRVTGCDELLHKGDVITITGNIEIVPEWRDRYVYTVTFISEGNMIAMYEAIEGKRFDISVKDPVSEGMEFRGWRNGDSLLSSGDWMIVTEDSILNAEWRELDKFVVTVPDGNGTKDIVVTEGQEYVIDLEDPTDPERIFLGWKVTGYDELLHKGDSIVLKGDTEIVPEWRDRCVYTVSFVSDGKVVGTAETIEGKRFTITIGGPTGTGKVFLGWSSPSIPGTLGYGDSIEIDGDITLTAQWRDKELYTLTFHVGNRTFTDKVSEDIRYTIKAAIPEDEEMVFVGWRIGNTGTVLTNGDSFLPERDTDLYAQWRDRATFTVTFVSDGKTVSTSTATEGRDFVIDSMPLESEGRIFEGWDDGSFMYSEGDAFQASRDIVLTAVWRDPEEFTVTVPNGDGEVRIPVKEGDRYVIDLDDPADPDRIFLGWRVPGCDDLLHKGDSIAITDDIKLVPEWRDRQTFTVTFVSDGIILMTSSVREGTDLVISAETPVKSDMVFLGWGMSGLDDLLEEGDAVSISEDCTLTAEWRDRGSFTLTFHDGMEEFAVQAVEGMPYTIGFDDPESDRGTFLGWSGSGSGTLLHKGDSFTPVGDTDLYAQWRVPGTCTITYISEGRTVATVSAEEGSMVTIHADVSLSGHSLSGWSDGVSTYADGTSFTVNVDTTFTAMWIERTRYTVTYHLDDGDVSSEFHSGDRIVIGKDVSRDGCRLAGWSASPDGYVKYTHGSITTVFRDMDLYPVWEEIVKPSVPDEPAEPTPPDEKEPTSGEDDRSDTFLPLSIAAAVLATVVVLMAVILRRS